MLECHKDFIIFILIELVVFVYLVIWTGWMWWDLVVMLTLVSVSVVIWCIALCMCALLFRYMKYLYPYECERKGLSSPGELQAAIDSNRREGRRPSYSSSLFRFSPSPSTAPHILSPPKMHLSALGAGTSGALNGLQASPGPSLKKGSDLKAVQVNFLSTEAYGSMS